MSDYRKMPTSREVWAVIRARHNDMVVFGSFSDPNGDQFGGGGTQGKMFSSFGFKNADYPLIEAETTWDIDPENPHRRQNEKHQYWLCLPKKEED